MTFTYMLSILNHLLSYIKQLCLFQKKYARLEYFDEFNAILPWQNFDTACADHYMCRQLGKGISGHVGIQVLQLMLSNVLR